MALTITRQTSTFYRIGETIDGEFQGVTISGSDLTYIFVGIDGETFAVPFAGTVKQIRVFTDSTDIAFTNLPASTLADLAPLLADLDSVDMSDVLEALTGSTIRMLNGGSLEGSDVADKVIGSDEGDFISGLGGNDNIQGRDGEDYLVGGEGNDRILGGDDDDIIEGGMGDDNMFGEAGNDMIYAGQGDDTVRGGAGNDDIIADDMFVFIEPGDGNDELSIRVSEPTGDDEEIIFEDDPLLPFPGDFEIVSNGNNVLAGGDGDDFIVAGSGNDKLFGGADNDLLSGGNGDDLIRGGDGDDVVRVGGGNNEVQLGAGFDTVDVTLIADVGFEDGPFVFEVEEGRTVVRDFNLDEDSLYIFAPFLFEGDAGNDAPIDEGGVDMPTPEELVRQDVIANSIETDAGVEWTSPSGDNTIVLVGIDLADLDDITIIVDDGGSIALG